MKQILVVYATREGHTRCIAGYLSVKLRGRGFATNVVDAKHLPGRFTLDTYCAVIVAASVHTGKHETEAFEFVRRYMGDLNRMPTAFVSVSLAEAGAEGLAPTDTIRLQARADVSRMIDEFLEKTGWKPTVVQAAAGALSYTKYNFLIRFVMKRIARKAGGNTDTSRDHEYTDWAALDEFADELVRVIPDTVDAPTRAAIPELRGQANSCRMVLADQAEMKR